MTHYRRRIRFVRPRLQLRLMGAFFGLALLALALQYLVFQYTLAELALALPHDGTVLLAQTNSRLGWNFFWAVTFLAPAMFAVGLMMTHRIAGPIYRFEQFLKDVVAGRARQECRIRDGDEFQDLCDLINRATERARAEATAADAATAEAATPASTNSTRDAA